MTDLNNLLARDNRAPPPDNDGSPLRGLIVSLLLGLVLWGLMLFGAWRLWGAS